MPSAELLGKEWKGATCRVEKRGDSSCVALSIVFSFMCTSHSHEKSYTHISINMHVVAEHGHH